eukprot:GHVS01049407.1.p1 GENE.GHVS01049407.1~~GHVS01049407.1.p1  ORF type:complete len:1021 (-),score=54.43 GHVS01049407.1:1443-4505(-)
MMWIDPNKTANGFSGTNSGFTRTVISTSPSQFPFYWALVSTATTFNDKLTCLMISLLSKHVSVNTSVEDNRSGGQSTGMTSIHTALRAEQGKLGYTDMSTSVILDNVLRTLHANVLRLAMEGTLSAQAFVMIINSYTKLVPTLNELRRNQVLLMGCRTAISPSDHHISNQRETDDGRTNMESLCSAKYSPDRLLGNPSLARQSWEVSAKESAAGTSLHASKTRDFSHLSTLLYGLAVSHGIAPDNLTNESGRVVDKLRKRNIVAGRLQRLRATSSGSLRSELHCIDIPLKELITDLMCYAHNCYINGTTKPDNESRSYSSHAFSSTDGCGTSGCTFQRGLEHFNEQDVSLLCNALAKCGLQDVPFFSLLIRRLRRDAETPQLTMKNCDLPPTKANHNERGAVGGGAAPIVCGMSLPKPSSNLLRSLTGQGLSLIVNAMAKLDIGLPDDVAMSLASRIYELRAELTGNHVATIFQGFTKLRVPREANRVVETLALHRLADLCNAPVKVSSPAPLESGQENKSLQECRKSTETNPKAFNMVNTLITLSSLAKCGVCPEPQVMTAIIRKVFLVDCYQEADRPRKVGERADKGSESFGRLVRTAQEDDALKMNRGWGILSESRQRSNNTSHDVGDRLLRRTSDTPLSAAPRAHPQTVRKEMTQPQRYNIHRDLEHNEQHFSMLMYALSTLDWRDEQLLEVILSTLHRKLSLFSADTCRSSPMKNKNRCAQPWHSWLSAQGVARTFLGLARLDAFAMSPFRSTIHSNSVASPGASDYLRVLQALCLNVFCNNRGASASLGTRNMQEVVPSERVLRLIQVSNCCFASTYFCCTTTSWFDSMWRYNLPTLKTVTMGKHPDTTPHRTPEGTSARSPSRVHEEQFQSHISGNAEEGCSSRNETAAFQMLTSLLHIFHEQPMGLGLLSLESLRCVFEFLSDTPVHAMVGAHDSAAIHPCMDKSLEGNCILDCGRISDKAARSSSLHMQVSRETRNILTSLQTHQAGACSHMVVDEAIASPYVIDVLVVHA